MPFHSSMTTLKCNLLPSSRIPKPIFQKSQTLFFQVPSPIPFQPHSPPESNFQPLTSPVTVCGETNGQFFDLLELFRIGGEIPNTEFTLRGDLGDRGFHSVEINLLLLGNKIVYQEEVVMLRGNHDSSSINN